MRCRNFDDMHARRAPWRRLVLATIAALAWSAGGAMRPAAAHAEDPMAVMRAFCRADGEGARLRASSWPQIGALVTWPLEPAWDHLFLISGYELATPRGNGDAVELDVAFTVTGEIRPGRILTMRRVDSVTFNMVRDPEDDHWRILGPPHPPYVFANNVDAQAMASLLAPESDAYESASAFVWRTLRRSGAGLDYLETAKLAATGELLDEPAPTLGAVAVYLADGVPYHAGIVAADGAITSATINAGIVTVPAQAFAGELRYRRLSMSPKPQAPTPVPSEGPTAVPSPRLGTWDEP